jgi:hypothetical protein
LNFDDLGEWSDWTHSAAMVAENFNSFGNLLIKKLITEIAQVELRPQK